ncbi:MAG: DUF4012 domain-containing protein [Patescibacteria group bacterium]|jgi:hypothetical protein
MALNNPHNLKVNPDVKSSRFVIDLKQNLPKEETKAKDVRRLGDVGRLEEKLEKLAEVDYKGILKAGSENAKKNIIALMVRSRNFWIPAFAGMTKEKPARNDKKRKNKIAALPAVARNDSYLVVLSNQLALIVLGKALYFILKKVYWLLYKICYAAGWTIVFILRLAYFLLLAIIKPIKKAGYLLFIKFHPAVNKVIKNIPQDLQAKQLAAVSIFARLLRSLRSLAAAEKKSVGEERDCFVAIAPRNDRRLVGYLKPVLIFAGILFIIILPVKAFTYYKVINVVRGKVLGASESAIGNLISAGQSAANFNFNQAGQGFKSAGDNFLSAQNELKEINGLLFALASVLPDKNMRLAAAGKNILRAGELSAAAGKNLSLAMESLFSYRADNVNNILKNLSFYGNNAITDLSELNKTLDQINSEVIPENYQTEFILLKQKAGQLSRGLKEFISLADSLGNFLGASAAKRYLLVFQNNSELRASGGFIGSFALIDFSKGEIKNIEVPGGGSYDTDAGFLKKIKAPEPLSLVRADWHFWDANWWPDWPTSAEKLAWFYENSDGSTVDGVISFTPTVMEKLLAIIGPVDLQEKYGLTIGADNFFMETQKLAEQKPDVTREPKKIIGDLMNKIIEELPKRLTKDNLGPLFKAIEESLAGKNILFYFTDEALQAKADDLGWSGRIKDTAGDYLNVINTNIAGGKSDRKIKQEIIQQSEIQPDGSIINNLTIRRVHEAIKREPFSGVRNVNWLRVYVPLGSELLEVSGFKPVDKIFFDKEMAGLENDPEVFAAESQARTDEATGTKIYNEFNKTVFANWSQLDPGETVEINIKYKLPFKLTAKPEPAGDNFADQLITKAGAVLNPEQKNLYSYSLLVQKQPGMNSSTITSELKLGGGFAPIWKYPVDLGGGADGWLITEDLNQDKIIGIIVEEK